MPAGESDAPEESALIRKRIRDLACTGGKADDTAGQGVLETSSRLAAAKKTQLGFFATVYASTNIKGLFTRFALPIISCSQSANLMTDASLSMAVTSIIRLA